MKKPRRIKTFTNDSDFEIVVYNFPDPNPEYNKFAVYLVDTCGISKPEKKQVFNNKEAAVQYAKELNKEYFFD